MKIPLSYFRTLPPLAAFLFFACISVVLWLDYNNHKRELIVRYTETSAEQIRIRIEGMMNARMASLDLLAARWVERRPPDFSKQRFMEFARAFYTRYPGFSGINWIDPDGVIRWVFPEDKDKTLRGKSVYQRNDSNYHETFRKISRSLAYHVTPTVKICQDNFGFDAFWPLIYEAKLQGLLNGVFQLRLIMEICLAKDILKNFRIRVYEDNRLIYLNGKEGDKKTEKDRLHVTRTIRFTGKIWRLELTPGDAIHPQAAIWDFSLLIFGLAFSAALSLISFLFLSRLQMYREARDHALYEVSERRQAEEALKTNEKRLQTLLSELADKNAELETFVYTVSHDLKTPIVTIEGFIGALREDFGDLISEEGERYLGYMSAATLKMEALINDLLELSRIGRLTVKKSRFSFAGVVEEALKELEPQILARGIEVKIREDLPRIYGERKRIVQVMENLLSNAVKYIGKENPSPRIDVGVEKQNGQEVFFVRDNGIGIEEIFSERIFQVFQRLPSAKKAGEGTGIGLAIARRVIENHGGSIRVTSEPGKGSTFFFTFKPEEV